jgi:hypothetical protein
MDPFAGGRGMGMDFSPPRQRGGGFGLFDMPKGGGFGGGLMDPIAPQRPPRRFKRRRPSSAYRHPKPKPYRVRPRYPMRREPEEHHKGKGVDWGAVARGAVAGARSASSKFSGELRQGIPLVRGDVDMAKKKYEQVKSLWEQKRKEALQERVDKGGIGALTKKEKQELLNSKETEIV